MQLLYDDYKLKAVYLECLGFGKTCRWPKMKANIISMQQAKSGQPVSNMRPTNINSLVGWLRGHTTCTIARREFAFRNVLFAIG